MKIKYIFFLWVIAQLMLSAQIPSYYSSIDFSKNKEELKADISSLLSTTHTTLLYYSNAKKPDVWKTLKLSDLDPENVQQNTVLLIYGYHDDPEDLMHNRTRSVDSSCHKSMYMHVRYPYQCEAKNTAESSYTYSAEMPDLYLKWNADKDPSLFEKLRNEVIYNIQGNRNPFIDNPYIATLLWGGPIALNTWGYMSVEELSNSAECKVYPTITSDNFVYVKGANIRAIYIYNISGNLLNYITYISDERIPIPNQVGIYFIKLVTDKGNQNFKIIRKP